MIIEAKNIRKSFARESEVYLEELLVNKGDVIFISGANGKGKTTVLKILSGISHFDSGILRYSKEYCNLRIAYIPQYGGLYESLSVEENLRIWHKLYGLKFQMEEHQIKWYINNLGLNPYLLQRVENLSLGLKKIATLACAFSVEPDGLFLDEPFASLHEDITEILTNKLKLLIPELKFLVIASHKQSVTNKLLDIKSLLHINKKHIHL